MALQILTNYHELDAAELSNTCRVYACGPIFSRLPFHIGLPSPFNATSRKTISGGKSTYECLLIRHIS